MNDKPQGLMSAEALTSARANYEKGLPWIMGQTRDVDASAAVGAVYKDIPHLLAHIALLTEERDHYRAAYHAERGTREYAERELLAKDA